MNSAPSNRTRLSTQASTSTPLLLPGFFRTLLVAAIWGAIIVVTIGSVAFFSIGKTGVEKNFTALCYPLGCLWFAITAFALARLTVSRARIGWWLLSVSLAIYGFGTRPLANAALETLENSFQPYSPERDGTLDALVVLGGGTTTGPLRPQAAFSGDRVVYAAELFHQGHVKQLITTGAASPGSVDEKASPSAQTVRIWSQLGVPESCIVQLYGINTSEEMKVLDKQLSAENAKSNGLLTSAFHIPRALRLAKSHGLEFIPVAADYRAISNSPARIVPHAENLLKWETVLHEYLAYFVAR